MKISLKRKTIVLIILIAACVAVIFGFSLNPGGASHSQSGLVKSVLFKIADSLNLHPGKGLYRIFAPFAQGGVNMTSDEFVRKLAHFTEYFIFGAVCFAAAYFLRRSKWFFVPLLFGLPVAAADEMIIQRFLSVGRTPSVKDILLDCIGFYCAVIVIFVVFAVVRAVRHFLKARRQ